MSRSNLLSWTFSHSQSRRAKRRNPLFRPKTGRLFLEQLESRVTPSFGLSTLGIFNGANGAFPNGGLVMDSNGNLYGTAVNGGASNDGTVFEVAKGSGTLTTLASFNGANSDFPDGGLVMDSSGNLYGTAVGTVFEVAKGSGTITTLASFNAANGVFPYGGLVMDSGGNLYGKSNTGGSGGGAIFELAKGSGTLTGLASFNGANGAFPNGGLIIDSSGNLYGTAHDGGANGDGTVFELAKGSKTITALASFNGNNGAGPQAGLILDSSGNFYGTTGAGGASNDGTVFELANGKHTITTLASFNGSNGADPVAGLILDSSGNLYGTASAGGASGDGTVFELARGSGTITTLASFNGSNGAGPHAGLILDSGGNLYGTASVGGASGDGTVFEVLPHTPALSWSTPAAITYGTALSSTQLDAIAADSVTGAAVAGTFVYTPAAGTILHVGWQTLSVTFTPTDTIHYSPITTRVALLVNQATPLLTWNTPAPITFGTALSSAQLDASAANSISRSPVSGTFVYTPAAGTVLGPGSITVLNVTFTPADTTDYTTAQASVTQVVIPTTVLTWHTPAPIPFGTALSSTQLDASATDSVTGAPVAGTFVYTPAAGAIVARGSTILSVTFTPADTTHYNTAQASVTLVVSPSDYDSTLASFNGTNGTNPLAGLIMDSSGNLYGTTELGGANGDGTVFELVKGSGTITTLATFNGPNGTHPHAGLIMDASGNLYGTTIGTVFELAKGSSTITTLAHVGSAVGGVIMDSSGNLYGTTEFGGGSGTVFELVKGRSTITTLATFNGFNGRYPVAGLIMDSSGNLYGTTEFGGTTYFGGPSNDGTVFELAKGSSTITTLAAFNGANGAAPVAGLIMDSSGNLYGTTIATVFELAKGSSTITTLATFNGANGAAPVSGLIMDSSGNLYGTTASGGANGDGTAFELAKGSGTITTLALFYGVNGSGPHGGLIMDSSGNFYGTTESGGANNESGSVFELLSPSAHQPYFQFSGFPSSTRAGASPTFTVTVHNADGTTDTGYAGTVHFTSTDPLAVLPANYPYTAADAGVHTFTATLKTAGTQSITATDLLNVVFTASATTTLPLQFPGSAVNYAVDRNPNTIAVGHFTSDGHLDLVTANAGNNTVSVLLGNGDGTFRPATNYPSSSGNNYVAVGDFNGDGKLDIVTSSGGALNSSDTVNVLLGNGDGTFRAPISFFLPKLPDGTQPFPDAVAVGDFNHDGKLDLAVTARASPSNTSLAFLDIFLGKGDGTFLTGPMYPLPNGPAFSLAVGSFLGSTNLDIAVTSYEANSVSLLKGNGDGTFGLARTLTTGLNPEGVAVGDLNGDGKPDLAVANTSDNSVSVFLATGTAGNFLAGKTYTVGSIPNGLVLADFKRDGHLDLATDNTLDNNVSVLLGNGDGTFQTAQNFGTATGPWWIASGDFNGDGYPDLATCNRYHNDVSVLIHNAAGGTGTASATTFSLAPLGTAPRAGMPVHTVLAPEVTSGNMGDRDAHVGRVPFQTEDSAVGRTSDVVSRMTPRRSGNQKSAAVDELFAWNMSSDLFGVF
jgi:uncharacterized repeat protein (TIGR03803 family)